VLVTESFVFLHIPRTGGTFIEKVVPKHLQVADIRIGKHAPHSSLPARWRELPAFCVIRNPWDWYVSWFAWWMQWGREYGDRLLLPHPQERTGTVEQRKVVWHDVLRCGQADFKEALARFCTADFPYTQMVGHKEADDVYSAYVKAITDGVLDRPDFTALRFERLNRHLKRYLRRRGAFTPELRAALREEPPRRATEHGHYAGYYDAESADLVGQKTAWFCERFGYSFDRSEAAAAGG
jgi:hypothetical protein